MKVFSMRAIHGLLAILLAVAVFLPLTAHAQTRASSYEFAPSHHSSVDKETSFIGYIFDDVDSFLQHFRGARGVMIFILSSGAAMLASILGLPAAAAVLGIFAGLVLLLNKPTLFAIALVPLYMLHRQKQRRKSEELRLDVVAKPNETPESLAIRRARKARKLEKKRRTIPQGNGTRNITARAS